MGSLIWVVKIALPVEERKEDEALKVRRVKLFVEASVFAQPSLINSNFILIK